MLSALPSLALLALLSADAAPPVPLLLCDSSRKRIAIVDPDGSVRWERPIGPAHDLHWLPQPGGGGHVLMQDSWTHLLEVDPATDQTVWEYDAREAAPEGYEGRVEVHAFQRLPEGGTLVALSGPSELVEVEPDGRIARRIALQVEQPHPHHDTRLVRKTGAGTYLVAHESDGAIREYDAEGRVVWSYEVPLFDRPRAGGHGLDAFGNQAFGVLRLDSGNTVITTGNGHGVIEVTPAKEIVWRLAQDDLLASDGIRLAWTTSIEELPNEEGYLLVNCHAGPEQPQVIALTREKRVLWTLRDFERFGNATTNATVAK